MHHRSSSLRRRAALGLAIGLTALAIVVSPAAPQSALAQSAAQNDPAWDYDRGGVEVPGLPAWYLPALDVTQRKKYSLNRPACNQWKLS